MVASTGTGTVRLDEYLREGLGGRTYWLVVSVTELALFLALPVFLAMGSTFRPDLDWGDPFRVGLIVVVSTVCLWCVLVWQSSVRAMVRGRHAPRAVRDDGEGED